jgi:hypothetical protein
MLSVLQVTPELNAGGVERTTIEMAEAISRAGGLALVASAGGGGGGPARSRWAPARAVASRRTSWRPAAS